MTISLLCLLLLLWSSAGMAQPHPVGTEFQVSSYTNGAWFPRVASDAEGNFIVVWLGPYSHIYGQRFSSSGQALGDGFEVSPDRRVVLLERNFFRDIDISASPDGAFVLVWTSVDNPEDFNVGVYARRFDSAGGPIGAEFQVNTYTSLFQYNPAVAVAPSGRFVVAWEDYDRIDPSGRSVSARWFDSDGAPVGSELQVGNFSLFQADVDVAPRSDGSFVLVWQDGGSAVGQIYGASGSQIGSEFPVVTNLSLRGYPTIQGAQDGSFVAVWTAKGGRDTDMFGRRFDSTGSPSGSEFQVNTFTLGAQYNVNHGLFVGPEGDFVVTWMARGNDMPDWPDGVSAQRFDSTGNKLGTELQVNTYTVGVQGFPAVTGDRDSFVITWMSDGEDGRFGIFGQRYFNEACPESTASDCVAASRSAVVMKSSAGAQSFGRLSWRWATDPPLESRSPVSPSHYLLCLYDGSGLVSEIRIDGSCNAAFCGSVSANASGRLRSRFSTDSRQTRRRSADGLSRVLLRVGGTGLSLPPFPLNDSAPVLVQLHPSAGLPCLEAGYTGPALRNDLNEYRNRIP